MRLLVNEATFDYPVKGRISSPFGPRTIRGKKQNHMGIDISVPPYTPIESPLDGEVIISKDGVGSCGGMIEILHLVDDKKITTKYCHLNSRNVSVGEKVKKGDIIGSTGGEQSAPKSKKGNSMGPHLHFAVTEVEGRMKRQVDPMKYIQKDFEVVDKEIVKPETLSLLSLSKQSVDDFKEKGDEISKFIEDESEQDSFKDELLRLLKQYNLEEQIIKRIKNKKTL